jgi:hypothetical protein
LTQTYSWKELKCKICRRNDSRRRRKDKMKRGRKTEEEGQ